MRSGVYSRTFVSVSVSFGNKGKTGLAVKIIGPCKMAFRNNRKERLVKVQGVCQDAPRLVERETVFPRASTAE